jgi:hypothetical protein
MTTLDKSYADRHPLGDALFFQVWPLRQADGDGVVYHAVAVYLDSRWHTIFASLSLDAAKAEAQRCAAIYDKPVTAVVGDQLAVGGGY